VELLDKYAETQDKLKSVIIRGETRCPAFVIRANGRKTIYEPRTAYEAGTDGERRCRRVRKWGNVSPMAPDVKQNAPHYRSRLWDGKYYYRYGGRLWIEMDEPCHKDDPRFIADLLQGFFWGTVSRVDSILGRSGRISVRDRLERVGGSRCYVIDALTEHGKYTLWIDPLHGYNIAKAENFKKEGDVMVNNVIREKRVGKQGSFYMRMQNVRFEKIEDVWVTMEGTVEHRQDTPGDPIVHSEAKKHVRRTEVIFNPDHEALRTFYPDDIPGGTEIAGIDWSRSVAARDEPYKDWEDYWEFRWLPGAKSVANERGRVVANASDKNLPQLAKILRVRRLAKDFELKPAGSETEGKTILLCFWDVKQEQSQQVLLKLRERQEALAQSGVIVVAVEASGTEKDKVSSWGNQNKLTFPVGTYYAVYEDFLRRCEGDPEREKPLLSDIAGDVNLAWRIDRLPWLILTDRNHVVAAEGFSLGELEGRIKDAQRAEVVTNKIARLASGAEEKPSGQLKGELAAVSEK
jgi:hypothetical protein